jgi:uncharacterized protein
MGLTTTIDLSGVAHGLAVPLDRVETVVRLLDAGNTVPFITRYRKDQTGGMDEEQIRAVEARVNRLRMLAERKQTILRSIEGQGKLTPELAGAIESADSTKRLEDLYLPFKPKKQSLATLARQRKLEPLSREILAADSAAANLDTRAADFVDPDQKLNTPAEVLLGVGHILAEDFSERVELRDRLRKIIKHTGKLVCVKTEIADKQGKEFRDYFEFTETLGKLPPHRILAINRGEKAKMLRVRIDADEAEINRASDDLLVPPEHPHAEFLRGCVRDALVRLVLPSLERDTRRELTEQAESHAVEVFAKNLRNLLLQPPVRGRRVLAVDPGFKSGCKLAVLDEFANLLDHSVIHLIGKPERRAEARAKLVELIKQHSVSAVALGNGMACRETEQVVAEMVADELKDSSVAYTIVNEAGASVYSTSPIGREEFPNYDATLRGAISIGRRMQDPLSELVKIDPANIGVGLYQHDVRAKHLRTSLDAVVESCVNYVGVDLNTASPALLRYVSGLNQLTARRLYDHRTTQGPFKSREQLKEVSGFGDATFVQAAGFLKISDGENPLDGTWIHPESYDVARRALERLGCSPEELKRNEAVAELAKRAAALDLNALAAELQVGPLLLADVVAQLTRPGRDPREDLPQPIFKRGILKLEDLAAGMELQGTVLNVVDFGVFVDIGLRDSGLVHVSQLANRYVRDPHEVAAVGDIVKVWVMEIDKTRRRVSLTMIAPGAKQAHPPRHHGPKSQGAKSRSGEAPAAQGQPAGRPRGNRPPRPEKPAATGVAPAGAPGTESKQVAGGDVAKAPDKPEAPKLRPERVAGAPNKGGRPHKRPQSQKFNRSSGPPQHGAQESRPAPRPKPKPPLIPISEAMKAGKEPLRTFGDLKQFFAQKEPEPASPAGSPTPARGDAVKPQSPADASPSAPSVEASAPNAESSQPAVAHDERPNAASPNGAEPHAEGVPMAKSSAAAESVASETAPNTSQEESNG